MSILSARYLSGCTSVAKCPPPSLPEYAFIGRSNVGKSSLINALAGTRKLAKTSSTPGKTRIINHFIIEDSWYLVDLPGYGYARISKKDRAEWERMIRGYLVQRENLVCVFVLIDVRIPPQSSDHQMMEWLSDSNRPFAVAYTKSDKLTRNELSAMLAQHQARLSNDWEVLPVSFVTSSFSRLGCNELLSFIREQNKATKAKGF